MKIHGEVELREELWVLLCRELGESMARRVGLIWGTVDSLDRGRLLSFLDRLREQLDSLEGMVAVGGVEERDLVSYRDWVGLLEELDGFLQEVRRRERGFGVSLTVDEEYFSSKVL